MAATFTHLGMQSMRLAIYACLALAFAVGCNNQRQIPGALSKNATLNIHLVSVTQTPTSKAVVSPATKGPIYLVTPPFISASDVATVHQSLDSSQSPALNVVLTPVGAAKMTAVTSANSGSQIAVVVNGTLIATPTIRAPIAQQFQITGVVDFDKLVEQLTTN